MQSQLGERFDVSQGVRRLQQPLAFVAGAVSVPLGDIDPARKQLLTKNMPLLCGGKAGNLSTDVFDGMFA